jgi:predicted permease
MSQTAEFWRRFRMLLRGKSFARDIEEEIRLHKELKQRELRDLGADSEQARYAASRAFGNATTMSERSRDAWGWRWLEDFAQDLRFGARGLRKSPGFTAVAVLTLAIGIGANTALFSVINTVLLNALPFPDAKRMVSVHLSTSLFPTFRLGLSWPAFERIRKDAPAIEQPIAYSSSDKTIISSGEPSLLSVTGVTEGFFDALDTRAQLGRLLEDADQQPGHDRVAVLSDTLWRERFGASPQIIGQSLTMDGQVYTIAGVAPKRFSYPEKTDIWTPIALPAAIQHEQEFFALSVFAKLAPGQKLERAQQQLAAIASQLQQQTPDLGPGFALPVSFLSDEQMPDTRRNYFMLFAASSFVLLISCANLASMLLARGLARTREMAVRTALGASRWRLIRQGLAESLLLGLLGCALSIGIAFWGIRVFQLVAPPKTPRLQEIAIDTTVLWFAVGLSVLAGLILGLAPAWRAAQIAPHEAMKQGRSVALDQGVRASRFRFGSGLVTLEVALAFVLLIGSALMTRTLANALRQNPGFRTDHLLTLDLPQRTDMSNDFSRERRLKEVARIKRIVQRVQSVPGAEQIVATDAALLGGMTMMQAGMQVEGAVPAESGIQRSAHARYISPGYFRMMQIPLLRGREFDPHDADIERPGVIVNEAMARQYWGTLDVLGNRISFGIDDKTKQPEWEEVIGVVANVRDVRIIEQPKPQYFLSIFNGGWNAYHLLVRTQLEPQQLAKVISHEIWSEFPDQPVTHVSTMTQSIAASLGSQRLSAVLLNMFAAIGLLLALIGVYGVIAFRVARRTQEVGIRMAIGAPRAEILRMILRQGMLPVAVGAVLGIGGALAIGRALTSQLYGVKPTDPLTFGAAIGLLAIVATLACYFPAKRATRVDPVIALRYE